MEAPPNILLITSDQHHYEALGVHTPLLQTPVLDQLANDGTLFERAYCNSPVCSPSRSSIITGKYPSSHGCWTIGVKLDESEPTVGELLSEQGYQTSLIGKAHFQPLASTPEQQSLECQPTLGDLDFWRGFHGPYYGFDHVELHRNHADESHAGQHYGAWLEDKGLSDWRSYFKPVPGPGVVEDEHARDRHSWDLPAELHYSTWTAERSIAAIERAVADEQPFFAWASFADPHPPYLVPEPYASMYDPADVVPGELVPGELEVMAPWFALTQQQDPDFSAWQETPHLNHGFRSQVVDDQQLRRDIATYYGMLTFLDEQIGRILDRLESLGVADNTLVVFTTDHGHFLGHHGLTAKGPFHYEDLLRVPFIVRFPGRVPAGRRTDSLLGLVDLAPTFLAAAGLAAPVPMQGINQLPMWSAQAESVRDHVIVENRHQPTAVHLRTYVEHRYKLTVYRDQPWGDLFDLVDDPQERHNRFDDPDYAEVKAALVLRFLNAELRREPMRYERIAGA